MTTVLLSLSVTRWDCWKTTKSLVDCEMDAGEMYRVLDATQVRVRCDVENVKQARDACYKLYEQKRDQRDEKVVAFFEESLSNTAPSDKQVLLVGSWNALWVAAKHGLVPSKGASFELYSPAETFNGPPFALPYQKVAQ